MAVILRRFQEIGSYKKHCFSEISTTSDNLLFQHDLYAPFPEMKHKVVGYCNGLFCLEYEDGRNLIWNPSTEEYKLLPLSDMELPPCLNPSCPNCKPHVISRIRGLGFDPNSGDYKVVRFVTVFYSNASTRDFDHGSSKRVEVYSLQADSWKEICPGKVIEKYDITDECATCVDEFCYWKARTKNFIELIIVSFDLVKEKFSTVSLPVSYCLHRWKSIIIEFEGRLGYVTYDPTEINTLLYPWVRVVKYGRPRWTKKMGFKVYVKAVERPLGYCRNGELLLLEGFDGKLRVYDSVARELKKIDEIYDHPHTMQLFPNYVKTTVSLSAFDSNAWARPYYYSKKKEKEKIKKEMFNWIKREMKRKGKVFRRRKRDISDKLPISS